MRKAYPDDKPVQFVNMAAGLDSRAYRLPWPSNVSVFEVDRAEVRPPSSPHTSHHLSSSSSSSFFISCG
jgi:hypothetical protein